MWYAKFVSGNLRRVGIVTLNVEHEVNTFIFVLILIMKVKFATKAFDFICFVVECIPTQPSPNMFGSNA